MSEETTTIEQSDAPPARLLVVDDEENILLTISEVLRLEGHEVETAASGHEAVSMLDAGAAYDLVLTDLHMEEGDGLLLLEEIRRRAPLTARHVEEALHGDADEAEHAMANADGLGRLARRAIVVIVRGVRRTNELLDSEQ